MRKKLGRLSIQFDYLLFNLRSTIVECCIFYTYTFDSTFFKLFIDCSRQKKSIDRISLSSVY